MFLRGLFNKAGAPVRSLGNRRVKHLMCLIDDARNPESQSNETQAREMAEFREKYGLSDSEFMSISNVLTTDYDTMRHIGGRSTHVDNVMERKLREAGVSWTGGMKEAVDELRSKYPEIQRATQGSSSRRQIVEELSKVFGGSDRLSSGAFSRVDSNVLDSINTRLDSLENSLVSGTDNAEAAYEYRSVINGIRQELKDHPEEFLIDTVAWMSGVLGYNSQYSSSNSSGRLIQTTAIQGQEEESARPYRELVSSRYQKYTNSVAESYHSKWVQEKEGRSLLIEADAPVRRLSFCPVTALGLGSTGYLYLLLTGSLPITAIVAGPAAAYWSLLHSQPQISHVYSNNGNLDVIIKKGGRVSEVIEGVSPADFKITEKENGSMQLPIMLRIQNLCSTSSSNLNAARNLGFPAHLIPVSIRGKQYYLDSSYRGNLQQLNTLGIRA